MKSNLGYISCTREPTQPMDYLQGAGIKFPGVSPEVSIKMYEMAVQSVLIYGCTSVFLNKGNIKCLDKLQSKFIKMCVGLRKCCHSTSLLQAAGVNTVSTTLQTASLDLLKSCLLSDSITKSSYTELILKSDRSLCKKP